MILFLVALKLKNLTKESRQKSNRKLLICKSLTNEDDKIIYL